MPIRVSLVALALVFAWSGVTAEARQKRLLDKATFYDMESVSSPQISPDGSTVVFSRGYVDVMADQNRSNLWVIGIDGARLRQLTDGDWSDSSPVWSPDGTRLAFLSDRSGSTQLHVMWADTRESLQVTRLSRAPGSIVWAPDGRSIAFTNFVPDTSPILPVQLPPLPRGAQVAPRETVVDSTSWARDGSGPTPRGFTHVFTIDAVVGGTPRQVTSGDYNHSAPTWSADGRTIYVSGIRKPDAEYEVGDSEIYAIDLASLEIRAMTDREGPDANPEPSPDGRWIAYTGYDQQQFTSHLSSLYLMDSSGNRKRLWVGNLPSSPSQVAWAPDGSGVYYSMQQEGEENTWFAPADQGLSPRRVTAGVHVLSAVSIARNGRAAGVL
jgi:Tol biopolymer transport system component